jgi:hypothetical protein
MKHAVKSGLALAMVMVGTMGASNSCAKSTTSPGTTKPTTAAGPTTTAAPPTTVAPTTTAPPAVVLNISGSGIKQTPDFTVTHDQWTIAYTFDCAAYGSAGNFAVDLTGVNGTNDSGAQGVNQLAPSGADTTTEHGAGTYYASINSECNWTVKITG